MVCHTNAQIVATIDSPYSLQAAAIKRRPLYKCSICSKLRNSSARNFQWLL